VILDVEMMFSGFVLDILHLLHPTRTTPPHLPPPDPPPVPAHLARSYLRKRYDAVVAQVPLMAVHKATRGRVDADMYVPPPLREGARGWYPEWGKIWQYWGIPRYTI
jgi:hypothetical protein